VLGIPFDSVANELVAEGVQKFNDPYERLLDGLAERARQLSAVEAAGPLDAVAVRLRAAALRMTTEAGSGHPTSCLSCADLVAALFSTRCAGTPSVRGAAEMPSKRLGEIRTASCSRRGMRHASCGRCCTRRARSRH
jgi:transketolase